MQINEAKEDYLERILFLEEKKGYARSVDIAESLGVTKASVSHSMKQLRESGYITMDKDNLIHLTEAGHAIARAILDRHTLLAGILIRLGVDEEVAYADACKMEHGISHQSFEALKKFVEKFKDVDF